QHTTSYGDWSSDVCSSDLIFSRTEGLPFFVEEIAAALTESGSLREGSGGLELDTDVALPLPESVRDAVFQRVGRLTHEQHDALEIGRASCRERVETSGGAA